MTGKTLYIEANTGISGDMFVGAMLDLGVSEDVLVRVLHSIPIEGFDIKISRKTRSGIDVCDFDVVLDHEHANHDHDMNYLYGHTHGDQIQKEHEHDHHHHHSHHRTLSDVKAIISAAEMSENAKKIAEKIFHILADAEAKAHGVPAEEVHFHEVGAVDSIVDIIAAAVCVDAINPDKVVISPLAEGSGTVRTAHGILPIPVPAVSHIVADNRLVLRDSGMQGEFVTPTGAAIAAAIKTDETLPAEYVIDGVGVGGGKREYNPPSILRAMLVETSDKDTSGHIVKLETDIDDSTGEELGHVMELLFEAGAREVHFSPIFMKKNRPGYELTVITTEDLRERLEEIIFIHTTTIGIRRQYMERTVLERSSVKKETKYGMVECKEVILPDGSKRVYPEYESVKKIAEDNNVSIRDIMK